MRKSESRRHLRNRCVTSRIEAGKLLNAWKSVLCGLDQPQRRWNVQRSEMDAPAQFRNKRGRDELVRHEFRPAMNHTMAHCNWFALRKLRKPRGSLCQRSMRRFKIYFF